jgi:hypothetical protein
LIVSAFTLAREMKSLLIGEAETAIGARIESYLEVSVETLWLATSAASDIVSASE